MKITQVETLILGPSIFVAARPPQELSLATITGEHHLKGLLRAPDLTVRDGCLRVPEGPGLGVELDEARLAELRQA